MKGTKKFKEFSWYRRTIEGWEMVQWVKGLLSKDKDPCLHLWHAPKSNSGERKPRQVDPQNSVDNRINEGYTVSLRIR